MNQAQHGVHLLLFGRSSTMGLGTFMLIRFDGLAIMVSLILLQTNSRDGLGNKNLTIYCTILLS